MLQKTLLIIFILCLTCCSYAQVTYKKCTVYSSKSLYSTDSAIAKIQFFNKFGRLTEERTYRNKNEESTTDTARHDQTILYSYIKDTLLYLKKTICIGGEERCLDDTAVEYYSYNSGDKITEIISASYGRGGTGCLVGIAGSRWYDSTKTVYNYDINGNIIGEAAIDMTFNMPSGFTLGFSPNFKAYTYNSDGKLTSISYSHIKSLDYFGADLIDNELDTTELAKEVFNYYKQCYTVDLVALDVLGHDPIHNLSIFFYDKYNNVIQEYINDRYLADYYGAPVERFYAYGPSKLLKKEIKYNEDGIIDQVDNYIYE